MSLRLQIYSLLFSFGYGIGFYYLLKINYKYIYSVKTYQKILFSFFFIIDMTLLYFIILKMINYGDLHVYFIGMIFTGYFIANLVDKVITKRHVKSNKRS